MWVKKNIPPGLPFGYDLEKDVKWNDRICTHLMGWLLTIFAICLGAPFWFDLLNKVANLRGNGERPASPVDKTKDDKK